MTTEAVAPPTACEWSKGDERSKLEPCNMCDACIAVFAEMALDDAAGDLKCAAANMRDAERNAAPTRPGAQRPEVLRTYKALRFAAIDYVSALLDTMPSVKLSPEIVALMKDMAS